MWGAGGGQGLLLLLLGLRIRSSPWQGAAHPAMEHLGMRGGLGKADRKALEACERARECERAQGGARSSITLLLMGERVWHGNGWE